MSESNLNLTMSKCVVLGCKNSIKKVRGVPMFCFPHNPDLRRKWIEAVNVDPKTIRENTKVCSRHFNKDDYFVFSTKAKLKNNREPLPVINLKPRLAKNELPTTSQKENEDSNNLKTEDVCKEVNELRNVTIKEETMDECESVKRLQSEVIKIEPSEECDEQLLTKKIKLEPVEECDSTRTETCDIKIENYEKGSSVEQERTTVVKFESTDVCDNGEQVQTKIVIEEEGVKSLY